MSACTGNGKSGFIEPKTGQISENKNREFGFSITPQTSVIVWMHGTTNSNFRENCTRKGNHVPPAIQSLSNESTHIYYLCSNASDRGTPGSYIYKRVDELAATLSKLHQAGLKSTQIFVAGHSAGGWAALMAMKRLKSKFNAAIVFSPACCGPRAQEERYPELRQKIRPQQIKNMLAAAQIKALVFAYEDDAYNRPQELQFLTAAYPHSVKIISNNCGTGHTSL
jgi:pimeloyl-ACP methyl ester carboxylesterase